jgi:hypothetical protein
MSGEGSGGVEQTPREIQMTWRFDAMGQKWRGDQAR